MASTGKHKILFIGPLPPPVHGQALHFMDTYRGVKNCGKYLVSINATGKSFPLIIMLVMVSVIKVLWVLFFKKVDTVYFTGSRSRKGGLFDLFVIGFSRIFGARVINHLHGAEFREYYLNLPFCWKKIATVFYRMTDTLIVLTEGMRDDLKPFFPETKIEVVKNFYAKDFERELTKKPSSAGHIVYVSNIMMSKGIFDLLDAFENVAPDFDFLRLSIAGDFVGDHLMSKSQVKTFFEKKINDLKERLPGRIHYLSVVGGEEKVTLFMNSDIFVLPSYHRSEALPLSIIEAMRTGNAIITTRHNYLPEIISEKNGFLVEPKSSVEIEGALTALLRDTNRKKQIQAYNITQAKALYSYDRYIENISRIFGIS